MKCGSPGGPFDGLTDRASTILDLASVSHNAPSFSSDRAPNPPMISRRADHHFARLQLAFAPGKPCDSHIEQQSDYGIGGRQRAGGFCHRTSHRQGVDREQAG